MKTALLLIWVAFTAAAQPFSFRDQTFMAQAAQPHGSTYAGPHNAVVWWHMQEGSGTTLSDSSGNGNTATMKILSGSQYPTWVAGPKSGWNALCFNYGGAGQTNCVLADYNFASNLPAFSISCWFCVTNPTAWSNSLNGATLNDMTVFAKFTSASIQSGAGWGLASEYDNLSFELQNSSSSYYGCGVNIETIAVMTNGSWVNWVSCCSNTVGKTMVISNYLNGVLQPNNAGSTFTTGGIGNTNHAMLGCNMYAWQVYGGQIQAFNGYIADVFVTSNFLTQAQVNTITNFGYP